MTEPSVGFVGEVGTTFDSNNRPARIVGVTLDITERRRLESERESALIKYQTLFSALPLGITIANREGQIIESNQVAVELLGLTLDEQRQRVVGSKEWHIIRRDGSAMPVEAFASVRALRERRVVANVEMGLVEGDKVRWINVTAAPLDLPDVSVVIAYSDISARMSSEQALRESEARHRDLVQNLNAGVIVHGANSAIVMHNRTAEQMMGLTSDQMLGKAATDPLWYLIDEDGSRLPIEKYPVMRVLNTRQSVKDLTIGTHRPDGTEAWAIVNAYADFDQDNNIRQVVVSCVDITARKLAEIALRESELRRKMALEAAQLGTWDWDLTTGKHTWSPTQEALFGYEPGTFPGTSEAFESRVHAEDRAALFSAGEIARKTRESFEITFRVNRPDGSQRWVVSHGRYEYDKDGKPVRVLGVVFDDTQRTHAEQALKEREEIFSSIVSQSKDAIAVVDAESAKFIEYNIGAHEGLGYTREEFRNFGVADIQAELSEADIASRHASVHRSGGIAFESKHRHKDGSIRDVQVSLRELKIKNRKYIASVWTDITEQNRAQQREARERFLTSFLLDLHQRAETMTEKDLYEYVLQRTIRLTESKIGFFHRVSEDQGSIQLTAWSLGTGETIFEPPGTKYPVEEAGIWADSVREKRSSIVNDYQHSNTRKGTPSDHIDINRFVTVPVVQQGVVRMILGVGNKQSDYDETDVTQLQLIANEIDKILQQRTAQEQIRSSEERFRHLVESAFDWIWEVDNNGVYSYASPKVKEILGYSPEEVVGKRPHDFSVASEKDRVKGQCAEALATQTPITSFISTSTNNQGASVILETSGVPVRGAKGELLGYRGTNRDITERQRAEIALRQSEAEFRTMFEMAAIGIIECDPMTFKILRANSKMCEFIGCSESDLQNNTFVELTHPMDAQQNVESVQRLVRGETRAYQTEKRFIRKDGTAAWANVNVALIRDEHGEPQRTIATIEDIGDRKRAEEERLRLVTAMEQAAESIVITDLDGRIVYVNPAFERTTGYTKEEALGRNPRLLRSGKQSLEFYRTLWKEITSGRVWHGRLVNRKKDGSLYDEDATISPIRDAFGKITNYIAIKLDITRQVELEAQVRQTQKLEAIGQLAGGVAHDFNNILAAMMMQLELLQMDAPQEDTSIHEALDDLTKEAKRAAELTRQLLMFSRRSVLVVKTIDLNAVIVNLLKMLNRFIREDITLTFEAASTLPAIEADVNMLEQVLMNLVVNARDAMPKGGRLTIRTTMIDISKDQSAGHVDQKTGRFVCMSVADTGCGMSAETMKRVFEPFFTTKEVGKGTGLGLATVHGIVAQHKGWVDVESTIDVGTTFHAYFPAIAQDHQVEFESQPNLAPPVIGRETVLLVEDDELVRKMVAKSLRRLGYQVFEALDGTEALSEWDKHKNEIDLLLTDMVLPGGMTGLEIVEQLREQHSTLPVIVTSGYSAEMAQAGVSGNARIAYLPKPYEMHTLAATVRKCLDEKEPK